MPIELKTALVAGSISIFGILVSFLVAWQARKSAVDLIKLKTELELRLTSEDEIRAYLVCLQMIRVLFREPRFYVQSIESVKDKQKIEIYHDRATKLSEDINEQFEILRNCWTTVSMHQGRDKATARRSGIF